MITTIQEKGHRLTCLQWFSNTMRHVSGSAVQGPGVAVLWPDRFPGPLGFNLLIQLILVPARDQLTITRTQLRQFQEKRSEEGRKYNDRGMKKRMLRERSGGEEEVRVVWKERNRRETGEVLSLSVSGKVFSKKSTVVSVTVWSCPPCRPCHPVWSQHHSIASQVGHATLRLRQRKQNI